MPTYRKNPFGGVNDVIRDERIKRVAAGHKALPRLLLASAVLILLCGGCDRPSPGASAAAQSDNGGAEKTIPQVIDGLPVVVADEVHSILDSRRAGRPYMLEARRASNGLILHAGNATLKDPERLLRPPNAAQMLYDRGVYSIDWPQRTQPPMVKLQPATLRTLRGRDFRGFSAGKQAYLAIGFQETDSSSGKVTFVAYWAGSVIFH